MKFFALALLTLVTSIAQAATAPPISVMQLYGGPTNGIVQSTGGVLGALNCGSNANYVPTWNVSGYFECAVGGGGGSGMNQLTGDVTAGPGTGSQAATVALVGGQSASNVAAAAVLANAATSVNTNSAIVRRDGSGNFSASTITGALTGNASTATALASNPSDCSANQFANAIIANGNLTCAQPAYTDLSGSVPALTALTGDVTASGTGSQATTLATVNSNVGSFTNASITVNAKGLVTAASSGSGGGITALTGDVTASGSGSVAATVAAVGGSTASAVGTATVLANAATNANTNSAIVKRDGSGNFSATTITASLTGHSSLDLPLTGGTLSGQLNGTVIVAPTFGIDATSSASPSATTYGVTAGVGSNIAGANNVVQGGNGTGTGGSGFIQFKTAPAAASSSTANTLAVIGQWTDAGLEIGTTTRKANVGLYIQQPNTSNYGGIQLANQAGTKTWSMDAVGTSFRIGEVGNNLALVLNTNNYWGFSLASGTGPFYPFEYSQAAGSTKPTLISSFVGSSGSFNLPGIFFRSRATTTNGRSMFGIVASDDNVSTGYGEKLTTATGSIDAQAIISNKNAGTLEDHVIVQPKGQIVSAGTVPAAGTCGTSPGTPTGTDNGFKIVSGTGGISGSCAVTLATAPITDGKCICEDETSAFNVKTTISGSTVTMTTYSATTGIAGNFTASDVFKCVCHYW